MPLSAAGLGGDQAGLAEQPEVAADGGSADRVAGGQVDHPGGTAGQRDQQVAAHRVGQRLEHVHALLVTDQLLMCQRYVGPVSEEYRTEHDSMGEVQVPAEALWRAQTQRAVENFPISGTPLEPRLVHALGEVKAAAAVVNGELDVLDDAHADAIAAAAREVADGRHDDHFPVDVFQTGSGTSSNMNANEVIASLAGRAGVEVHPNDHVNASQSSNDTFPTADPRGRRRSPWSTTCCRRSTCSPPRWRARPRSSPTS